MHSTWNASYFLDPWQWNIYSLYSGINLYLLYYIILLLLTRHSSPLIVLFIVIAVKKYSLLEILHKIFYLILVQGCLAKLFRCYSISWFIPAEGLIPHFKLCFTSVLRLLWQFFNLISSICAAVILFLFLFVCWRKVCVMKGVGEEPTHKV